MTAVADTTDVFQAFADATRLRILNLLVERELCVCDLCALLDVDQPKASRHLAYLRRARLVDVRDEGKWKYYRIAARSDGLRRTLMRCVKSCLRELEPLQDDLHRLAHHVDCKC
ncbi:MAG: metalloregulator ArsR/SmtB family transcription factor [Planctomycetota bacterium]